MKYNNLNVLSHKNNLIEYNEFFSMIHLRMMNALHVINNLHKENELN